MKTSMYPSTEAQELMGFLEHEVRDDLISAFPVICSNIVSSAVLNTLRASASSIVREAQIELDRNICVVAFGSLGRLEFVPQVSDLDSIIIIEGDSSENIAFEARSRILTPLALQAPWLQFDHGELIREGRWRDINKPDIPYPVVGSDELRNALRDSKPLLEQRRWHILLEGRVIFNGDLFNQVYDSLAPGRSGTSQFNFQDLTAESALFFGSYYNPKYLYKSQYKYFKTRFLRDYFIFSSQLLSLLGWYTQETSNNALPNKYIRASTAIKLIRARRFADVLESECLSNPRLKRNLSSGIDNILEKHYIPSTHLDLYGKHYVSKPGRHVAALIMALLSKFASCWGRIYSAETRSVLENISTEINLDVPFPHGLQRNEKQVVDELQGLRDNYQSYMSATREIIRYVFADSQLWTKQVVPEWVKNSF